MHTQSNQSTIMANQTVIHKMDNELKCPTCRRYFQCPLLLPCGHSLCNYCANNSLLPSSEPNIVASINTILQLNNTENFSPINIIGNSSSSSSSSTTGSSIGCSSGINSQITSCVPSSSSNPSDSDQLSVVSETDSGVVVTSRPGSYIGRLPIIVCSSQTNNNNNNTNTLCTINQITSGLICPICNQVVGLFDEKGLSNLPRNRALERVISKFVSPDQLPQSYKNINDNELFPTISNLDPINRSGGPLCQLCEEPQTNTDSNENIATYWCENCEIFYCNNCREKCHPSRGPFIRHALHMASKGVEIIKQKRRTQPTPCITHRNIIPNLYCVNCRLPVCHECIVNNDLPNNLIENHSKHEIQPLIGVCKSRKTELSQALQALSEKARSGTEYIQRLRSKSEMINQNMNDSEKQLIEQFDALICVIETKKKELTEHLHEQHVEQIQCLKEQISRVTTMLTRSTGLIQFCIEMLKESDPCAFLLVSQTLIARTQNAEHSFAQELQRSPPITELKGSILSLTLSPNSKEHINQYFSQKLTTKSSDETNLLKLNSPKRNLLEMNTVEMIRRAIQDLGLEEDKNKQSVDYFQFINQNGKINDVPTAPVFRVEECISERNVITLVWQPTSTISIDRYTLELDDGAGGNFKKVYRGRETVCTVEGLHFRSIYRARVKAHNQAGDSLYSERICLQTSDFTWFHLDSSTAPPEILLTNGNRTVTSQLAEDRVVLGSTGLSRGVHYWEFTVDRCDPGGQPAFGVARHDCNKEIMLGFDMRSWSVYFDYKRSWFLHNGEHFERTDGGVRAGSVVGIRLDCNRGNLSYYLNDQPHGPIAFTNLPSGIYYPAVSLSRCVQLTLHSGLEAPSESEESDEDSSGGGTGTETTSMATTVLTLPTTLQSIGKRQ